MRREMTSLALRLSVIIVPVVALAVLGTLWLTEHGRWMPFGFALAAITAACLLGARISARPPPRASSACPPDTTWPDAGNAAWVEIERIAERVAQSPPSFGDMTAYQNLGLDVLDTVGRHFYPSSKNPRLELTLAQTLAIVERVLRDIRENVLDAIPGGRSLTIAHLDLARRAHAYVPAALGATRAALFANRLRRWLVAWPVAVAYEFVNLLDVSPAAAVRRQADRIAADLFIRRTGTYAIDAFADRATLDFKAIQDIAHDKPLRVLLLGPLNAGKSSLLNAMFGQERSRRDILPCPGSTEEHILARDGIPRAIIIDSDGFGGAGDHGARARLFEAIQSVDVIVAVTSARQAARHDECAILDEIRKRFASSPRRTCPPILVAATHIDLLRPAQEWNPPYDFFDGQSPKEQSVRQAIDAIASDFQVPLERVIPVSLIPGREYNVEEQLFPSLGSVLPEADRAKLLRIIEETKSAESRERINKNLELLLATGRQVLTSLVPK